MPAPSNDAATPHGGRTPGSVGVLHRPRSTALGNLATLDLAGELLHRIREADAAAPTAGPRVHKHLGILASELTLRCTHLGNRLGARRASGLIDRLRMHPDFHIEQLRGATCVDVGCGSLNPLGQVFQLLCNGIAKGIAIDGDSVDRPYLAARALYDAATAAWVDSLAPDASPTPEELHARLAGIDLRKLERGDPTGVDGAPIEFRCSYLENAGLETGEADIVFSTSFLEHVPDPRAIVAELARISAPGAIGTHVIDGTDHLRYGDPDRHPLQFYRDASDAPLVGGCNRVPPLDFTELFEAEGFEVRRCKVGMRVPLEDHEIAGFAAPFRDRPREVLESAIVTFAVRRR